MRLLVGWLVRNVLFTQKQPFPHLRHFFRKQHDIWAHASTTVCRSLKNHWGRSGPPDRKWYLFKAIHFFFFFFRKKKKKKTLSRTKHLSLSNRHAQFLCRQEKPDKHWLRFLNHKSEEGVSLKCNRKWNSFCQEWTSCVSLWPKGEIPCAGKSAAQHKKCRKVR